MKLGVVVEQAVRTPVLLSLEGSNAQPLSIRAKALVFNDPLSVRLLAYIEQIGPSEAPVLIGGETGTGKELVARHIHHLSGRKGPFLAVNCGAISDQLAESELFGHEAGAFTGAQGKREGWFEAANGGTLFLDEIGDLPLALQVKLLRVLQEKEVVRIGSRRPVPVNVRLVAATNVDLDFAVAAGHFRQDLLYRINIAQLRLPPLRERPGDVLPLAEHFLKNYCQKMQQARPRFSAAAVRLMQQYSWPGNIRELENVVHFALLVARDQLIEPEHLKVTGGWAYQPRDPSAAPALSPQSLPAQSQSGYASPRPNGAGPGAVAPTAGLPTSAPQPAGSQVSGSLVSGSLVTGSAAAETPWQIIAQQLQRLFTEQGDGAHHAQLERLLVETAFRFAGDNQVHSAALLGITRNVMRTLLKRYGLLDATPRPVASAEQPSPAGGSALEGSWDYY